MNRTLLRQEKVPCQLRSMHLRQWRSNRGPQGPLDRPAKQFSLERKLNTRDFFGIFLLRLLILVAHEGFLKDKCGPRAKKFEHD